MYYNIIFNIRIAFQIYKHTFLIYIVFLQNFLISHLYILQPNFFLAIEGRDLKALFNSSTLEQRE